MNYEILKIETAVKLAELEKENKCLEEAIQINHQMIEMYTKRIHKALRMIRDNCEIEMIEDVLRGEEDDIK